MYEEFFDRDLRHFFIDFVIYSLNLLLIPTKLTKKFGISYFRWKVLRLEIKKCWVMNRTSRNWRSQNVPFQFKIKGFKIKYFCTFWKIQSKYRNARKYRGTQYQFTLFNFSKELFSERSIFDPLWEPFGSYIPEFLSFSIGQ